MDLKTVLEQVQSGELDIDKALNEIRHSGYENMGFAKVDHQRKARSGFPEVIFCPGKKTGQIIKIAKSIAARGENVLATRAEKEVFEELKLEIPEALYHEDARIIEVKVKEINKKGCVAVCTAGTADIPVAEEAAVTAEACGCSVKRIYDVGVAGIHRLFDNLEEIRSAKAVITVAGMEGALASVVGGLVDKPVVAVPTSVGYGANFGGVSALLTMLNSCSSGIGVVNIDNGFGAGVLAAKINLMAGN